MKHKRWRLNTCHFIAKAVKPLVIFDAKDNLHKSGMYVKDLVNTQTFPFCLLFLIINASWHIFLKKNMKHS
jgi:hypothetical protein